jgi:glycosyltransferase involved in cell wall biosynthesis
MIRVCHFTSVHARNDPRIFGKECLSLAAAGYEVNLVVSDGKGDEIRQGVKIWDAGRVAGGRARRMLLTSTRVWWRALKLHAEIYHFHDPELIPAGLVLRLLGRRVVYDVHEDVARSLENRPWVPAKIRRLTACGIESLERVAAQVFDLHMVVTPEIARRFPPGRTVLLRNFPIQTELRTASPLPSGQRAPVFVYVGAVSPDRGALVMVQAINHPRLGGRARLVIGGAIEPDLIVEMQRLDRLGLMTLPGHLPREAVATLLSEARAGLVLLQPVKAHMDAYPVKMFEYMAAGLPVIASHHPVWKQLLGGGQLALLVDPTQPEAIAGAMAAILEQPELADRLAQRGAQAVKESYNWEREKDHLLEAYDHLHRANST